MMQSLRGAASDLATARGRSKSAGAVSGLLTRETSCRVMGYLDSVLFRTLENELRDDVQRQDQHDQNQRRGPRELHQVLEGAARKVVDEHRQRRDRGLQVAFEPVIA